MSDKKIFCSMCKHSRYVLNGRGETWLSCDQREAFGQRPLIPKDCRDAEECLAFDPERWRDSLTTRSSYKSTMCRCKIPLEEAADGILSDVELE